MSVDAVFTYLKNSKWEKGCDYDDLMALWATLFKGDLKSVPSISYQRMNFSEKQFVLLDEVSKIPVNERNRYVVLSFVKEMHLNPFYNNPLGKLESLKDFYAFASPDFSVFPNVNTAFNETSIIKNRMFCNFAQRSDNLCIYTLSWTDESSFHVAMDNVERGSVIAVSADRVTEQSEKMFSRGYECAINKIAPETVIWYGKRLPCSLIYDPEKMIFVESRMRAQETLSRRKSLQLSVTFG